VLFFFHQCAVVNTVAESPDYSASERRGINGERSVSIPQQLKLLFLLVNFENIFNTFISLKNYLQYHAPLDMGKDHKEIPVGHQHYVFFVGGIPDTITGPRYILG
jgi:hypothetical protein